MNLWTLGSPLLRHKRTVGVPAAGPAVPLPVLRQFDIRSDHFVSSFAVCPPGKRDQRSIRNQNVEGLRRCLQVRRVHTVPRATHMVNHKVIGDIANKFLVRESMGSNVSAFDFDAAIPVGANLALPQPARLCLECIPFKSLDRTPAPIVGTRTRTESALGLTWPKLSAAIVTLFGNMKWCHLMASLQANEVRRARTASTVPGFSLPELYQIGAFQL